MPAIRSSIWRYMRGPGRAVPVLSVTQILCWGILIYPPVLIVPPMAAAHGWSLAFGMAGFSLALVTSGLLSPIVGGLIDRFGGNVVMACGALSGALGMAILAMADAATAYFACWLLIGTAMASTLYDPAFATLTRIFGATARRQITFVTFAGGFASTVGWPATHLLIADYGWRGAYVAFAAVLALVVAPLHAFALPRVDAAKSYDRDIRMRPDGPTDRSEPPHQNPLPGVKREHAADDARPQTSSIHLHRFIKPEGKPFLLLAAAFALHAFILSGVASNLLTLLERGGIAPATAVTIGALFGPAQVGSRLMDFIFADRTHPRWIASAAAMLMAIAFVALAASGISVAVAAVFAIAFGAANGVMTIARGALPLVMFGPAGYGRVIGRIARPALFVQACAPFAVASAVGVIPDRLLLVCGAVGAVAVLTCLLAIRPAPPRVS